MRRPEQTGGHTSRGEDQAKLTLGQFEIKDEKERRPFDAYFRNWLETYGKAHLKESTFAGYEVAFRVYLLPRFGQKDITQITREEVKKLAYEMPSQKKSRSYVKEQLGHHSIQVTVDVYGHLMPGGNKAAVDRLDDLGGATVRNLSATNAPNEVL